MAVEEAELFDVMKAALKAAYERGKKDGALEMRSAIFHAVAGAAEAKPSLVGGAGSDVNAAAATGADSPQERAPRGAVTAALVHELTERPGQSVKELELAVTTADPRIAVKTVGNTLRRLEGQVFMRDKDYWYPIHGGTETSAEENVEPAPASESVFE